MKKEKFLLTVLTYPQPSVTYDDNFCTAGFKEDGSMIRVYPVSFNRYKDLHKYTFLEMNLKPRRKGDFRPESYSPIDFELSDVKFLGKLNTDNNWKQRKEYCLKNVCTDFDKLIRESKEPVNRSLAVFKPAIITDFTFKETDRDWKPEWKAKMNQYSLFGDKTKKIQLKKVPYDFKYVFTDSKNKIHKLKIFDWEIGALYWNCLKSVNGDEKEALQKVKDKYLTSFLNREIYFFLGTTLEWHIRRAKNPFVIIGVFYPPKDSISAKLSLFG